MEDKKIFANGGMNLDDAIEDIAPNDYIEAYNIKTDGVAENEIGNVTDIESMEAISYVLPDGINKTISSTSFNSIRKIIDFTYNSAGNHRISEYDYDTGIRTTLFENLTDSGGIDILHLDPKIRVKDIKLIEDTYLAFLPSSRVPSIINLDRLRSGGYGVLKASDFTLIKPQPSEQITPVYGDDAGASSNLVTGKLIQFRYQYIYLDNEPSAWSSISKRAVPSGVQTVQTDVTKDNHLELNVDIGTDRVKEIRVAFLSNENTVWKEIKNIKRSDAIAITNTSIDIDNNVREAYNPTTNDYIFLFYNNIAGQPIDALETDLDADAVPLTSGALELANGNVILLADNKENYDIPKTSIDISVSYENSGIQVNNTNADALKFKNYSTYLYATWSFLGGTRGVYNIAFDGIARTGDTITIRIIKRGGSGRGNIISFPYLVPATYDGNTQGALNNFGALQFPLGFNVYQDTNNYWVLRFTANYQYVYLDTVVTVAATTSAEFNSKSDIKLNSSYGIVIIHRDEFGRAFPASVLPSVTTLHYGATQGNVPIINWSINNLPPIGAFTYQFAITYNLTHLRWLYINAKFVSDQGSWNASTNTPTLASSTGIIGQFYQVSVAGSIDLGNGTVQYNIGDYIIYNGLTYDRILYSSVQKDTGSIFNLGNTSGYIMLYIGSLNKFNKANSTSILNYDFSVGDRCTVHYSSLSGGTWFENPAIDVEVIGYDSALNILKIRKPTNLDTATYIATELLIEIYTPKKQQLDSSGYSYFEVGDIYKIIDGDYSVKQGRITEADSYIKTREYLNASDYTEPNTYLVEDPNYSDFYISNYYSYGRPHTYNSLAKQITNKADIRYSDVINTKNNINMLGRFYPERVETYDYTKGAIRYLVQRGNIVVCLQEFEHCYIPIEQNIIEAQDGQLNVAISDKLLNKARYPENNQAGIGNAIESFVYFKGTLYFIDPFRSEPCKIGYSGLVYIRGKLSKFFKKSIQEDYNAGKKQIGWMDVFSESYILSTEYEGDITKQITFSSDNWISEESYVYPLTYTLVSNTNGTAVITGNSATFTPDTDFVGNANFVFSFDEIEKKACIGVIAGDTTVNPFFFLDITGATVSTLYESNNILVSNPNIPVPISITGGEWTKDDGTTWQSTAGTVIGGDIVRVRQTSSSSGDTSTNTVLTISGVSDTYTVTTINDALTNYRVDVGVSGDFITADLYRVSDDTLIAAPISITVYTNFEYDFGFSGSRILTISLGNTGGVSKVNPDPEKGSLLSATKTSVSPTTAPAGGSIN